ncbi:hypothetical protein ACCAA_350098 [Candidatus Accumulibacter aalborgensis]|uniref:Uncharacterized protein n=1 Tax=Candidatus Accumulibacter aalborgensis TaxID=1860102 RepID=A0A1A8XRX8_9PROT|nr:hypothetical protein ACCAA_350098 [Candidatus Accumulibacter aalborgensis]
MLARDTYSAAKQRRHVGGVFLGLLGRLLFLRGQQRLLLLFLVALPDLAHDRTPGEHLQTQM